ncbi:MAG: hypothetical protein QG594_2621 [Bacteroidota bacterium]|nr:hypothetical protein [Bacteroidota bacterium]
MKKIIFGLIAIFGISITTFAQVTLEHSYVCQYQSNKNAKVKSFLTDNGLNYYTLDDNTNIMKFYNSSHVLYKTINVPIPNSTSKIYYIQFISDKLFNSDSNIEFIVTTISSMVGGGYNSILCNENGVILQQFGNKEYSYIIKDNSNNFKLIMETNYGDVGDYDVYSLSGSLSNAQQKIISKDFIGIPNPVENIISISNNLQESKVGILEVFDLNGKKVIQQNVIGGSDYINLEVKDLSNGVYIYKLNGQTNKFIKE